MGPQFLSFPKGTLLILLKEFNIENRLNSVANYCCLGLVGCLFCSCSLIYIYSIWFLTSCPLKSIFNVFTILTGLILFPSTVINHPNIFWFIFWPQQLWQDHQNHTKQHWLLHNWIELLLALLRTWELPPQQAVINLYYI